MPSGSLPAMAAAVMSGRKEGERQHHMHRSLAAALAPGDRIDVGQGAGHEIVEPGMAATECGDERLAGLWTHRHRNWPAVSRGQDLAMAILTNGAPSDLQHRLTDCRGGIVRQFDHDLVRAQGDPRDGGLDQRAIGIELICCF